MATPPSTPPRSETPPSAPSDTPGHLVGSALTGAILVIATLAAWTITPILIRYFVNDIDPWSNNGIRYAFAAVCWMPLLIWTWSRGKLPATIWRRALVPAMINAAAQTPFTLSLYIVEPGLVAFGLRMQIVTAAIGAAILFPAERLIVKRPLFIIGIMAVISGTIANALLGSGSGAATESIGVEGMPRFVGVICAMAAGAGYACYSLGVRKNLPHDGAMISFAVISQYTAAVQLLIWFGIAAVFAMVRPESDLAGWKTFENLSSYLVNEPGKFGLLLLSSVIGIALGHVLFYGAMKRLGVAPASGVIQIQPFTVSALSVPLYGEILSAGQWFAGAIAVGGAILMLVVQRVARGHALKPRDGEAEPEAFEPDPEPDPLADNRAAD